MSNQNTCFVLSNTKLSKELLESEIKNKSLTTCPVLMFGSQGLKSIEPYADKTKSIVCETTSSKSEILEDFNKFITTNNTKAILFSVQHELEENISPFFKKNLLGFAEFDQNNDPIINLELYIKNHLGIEIIHPHEIDINFKLRRKEELECHDESVIRILKSRVLPIISSNKNQKPSKINYLIGINKNNEIELLEETNKAADKLSNKLNKINKEAFKRIILLKRCKAECDITFPVIGEETIDKFAGKITDIYVNQNAVIQNKEKTIQKAKEAKISVKIF